VNRTVRLTLGVVAAVIAIGAWPAPASAHPLGNFTVNAYGGLIVQPEAIVVDYVVDMAEIPAFRERRAIDADLDEMVDAQESLTYREAKCATLADGLVVRVGGTDVSMTAAEVHALTFPAGAGGLPTLRLECRLVGKVAALAEGTSISLQDRNFPDSLGWRELTAIGDGVTLTSSDVPERSATDRLLGYTTGGLPSDVRVLHTTASPGGPRLAGLPEPGAAVADDGRSSIGGRDGVWLAELVGRDDITPMLVAAMVAIALGAGALHALGPGHGKTLIGAYLVGAGGSMRHAVGVGAAVSVMHTASVLALGLLVLSAERVVAPERVYPVLGLASGLIALGLGSALLVSRIHHASHAPGSPTGSPTHDHPHEHAHPQDPGALSDGSGSPLSRRGLIALAFSGGILPSPTALVVLLASVSLGRTALGLALIAAFSLGLAAALIGVGILTVHARDLAERRSTDLAARVLPMASAAAIAGMGLFLTVRGAIQL
jgi:nickel/cobalt exporter